MGKNKIAFVFLFVFFALFNTLLYDYLINNPNYYQLDAYTYESDGFRAMAFGEKGIAFSREFGEKHEVDPSEVLSILMLDSQFNLKESNLKSYTYLNYQNLHHDITRKKQNDYQKLANGYRTILEDLVYFPYRKIQMKKSLLCLMKIHGVTKDRMEGKEPMKAVTLWLRNRREVFILS